MDDVVLGRRAFLGTGALLAGAVTVGVARAAAANTPSGDLPAPITLPQLTEAKEHEKTKMPTLIPPDKRVGIAVVGLGRLALETILPAFAQSKRVKIAGLVSGDADKAARVAEIYGVPKKAIFDYRHFERLADHPEIHAVYIVLPNSLHAEYTVRAAKAGKHVLCEKPMATSVAEAEQMISACRDAKKKLMIAYRIQYEPKHRQVMRWVREKKEIGDIKLIQLENCQNQSKENLSQWRLKKSLAGGGALPDIGLYCSNTARFIVGEEPVEVGAVMHSTPNDPRFKEVEETINWWMRFPSGVMSQSVSSYGGYSSKRYRVIGTKGWLEMDPAFPYEGLQLKRSRASDTTELATVGIETIEGPQKNQFTLELDHFGECITSDKEPYTPGAEGLQDQRVMAAIYQAAATGKSVSLRAANQLDAFRGTPPTSEEK